MKTSYIEACILIYSSNLLNINLIYNEINRTYITCKLLSSKSLKLLRKAMVRRAMDKFNNDLIELNIS